MKQINLSQNKCTLVDDRDFKWLNQWKWHYLGCGYAARREYPSRKYIYLHRLIMNPPKDMTVDHINMNKLDNRRNNMRICTQKENNRNTNKRTNNTSGYKGVVWHKQNKCWMAEIRVNKKNVYICTSKDKKLAALAYNKAVRMYFGKYARINLI